MHAFASAGGNDTAHFYGDQASGDTFVREAVTVERGASGAANMGSMFRDGGGYWNRAKYYEKIYAHLGSGGDDTAIFKDSAGDYRAIYGATDFELYDSSSPSTAKILAAVDGLGDGDALELEDAVGDGDDDSVSILATPLYDNPG